MQKIILYSFFMALFFITKTFAQEKTFEKEAREIALSIERITKEQKNLLKKTIDDIENQVKDGKITTEQATLLKTKAAEERAAIIETKVALEEAKLTQLVKDKVEGKIASSNGSSSKKDSIKIGNKTYEVTYTVKDSTDILKEIKQQLEKNKEKKQNRKQKRTTSQFVFAAGLNNLVAENQNIEDTDFRVWGSHFYEWGFTYNTRIFKNSNLLHLKYGYSVMYNNLRPTENRYFIKNGDQTVLATHPNNLKESRLRNVYLVFPAHLEFDFTPKKVNKDGEAYYRTHESVRIGIGGFAGVRVKSKQILKYELDGDRIKDKQKGDFNTSNFAYGLSAYVGYKQTSFYVKYDLNPLFTDNLIDQNNVSFGVRFDFN